VSAQADKTAGFARIIAGVDRAIKQIAGGTAIVRRIPL
jgi:hypothetical protein